MQHECEGAGRVAGVREGGEQSWLGSQASLEAPLNAIKILTPAAAKQVANSSVCQSA